MPRTLWIIPKWPLPADDGARVATRALLANLPDRANVDVLALAGDDERCDPNELKECYGLAGKVFVFRRQAVGQGIGRHLRNAKRMIISPGMPATVSRYGTPALQKKFAELLASEDYSQIVLDGLHVGALSARGNAFVKPEGIQVIYRAHNVEWQIWQRAAANSRPALRLVLGRQFKLMKAFELSVIRQAALIAPVSEEDMDVFKHECDDQNYHCIPIGLNFPEHIPPMPGEGIMLGYIGRLDWPPNRDGLQWFLDKVWPKIGRDDVHLMIAGSGGDQWLKPLIQSQNIRYLGRVDDVSEFYSRCHAAVVPIFYGSGTRLKMIEPACFGRPCISTHAGAMGSTLTVSEFFHVETADDWVSTIESLTVDACRDVASRARAKLMVAFDQVRVAECFAKLSKSL